MIKLQQFLTSIFRGPDVTPVTNGPVAVPDTARPEPLNPGTSDVNPQTTRTVSVLVCGGETLYVKLGPSTTLKDLKSEIQQKIGCPANMIRLVFHGKAVGKDFDMGLLKANDHLLAIHRLLGGGPTPETPPSPDSLSD